MVDPGAKLRLAAVLAADVVGYTRLMADDEAATMEALETARDVFRENVSANSGRIVDTAGDSVLAMFDNAAGAVRAALAIQDTIDSASRAVPESSRMRFRVGVHLGDINEKSDGSIYGDGVNIAARLEGLAEPGDVTVSNAVQVALSGRINARFDDLGLHEVKNVAERVQAFRVSEIDQAVPKPTERASFTDPLLALPTGPSIAVLPFDNLSGDPEQDYFADGMTDEIITALTRFRDLFVIGRNTSFQYRGRSVDVRKIGEVLGVRYVVEGTVRRATGTIRISAQLTDAKSAANLWAESYDRLLNAENVLAVQDEITDQIVGAIADPRGVIFRAELLRSESAGTEHLESYECVLRARQFWRVLTVEEHLRARECLERTVAIDPGYAEAWAWLGEIYLSELVLGTNDRSDKPNSVNRAFEAGRRAVHLDPRNQLGHYILAQVYYHMNELDSFQKEADLALRLNPNDANLLGFLGFFKGAVGQWELGASLAKKAMTINPQGATWVWVITIYNDHYSRKEYDEALAAIKNWDNPEFVWLHINLASVYGQLGDTENAHAAVARLLELYPDFGNRARDEIEIWIRDKEWVNDWLDGLRKAGLDVPDEPLPETD